MESYSREPALSGFGGIAYSLFSATQRNTDPILGICELLCGRGQLTLSSECIMKHELYVLAVIYDGREQPNWEKMW